MKNFFNRFLFILPVLFGLLAGCQAVNDGNTRTAGTEGTAVEKKVDPLFEDFIKEFSDKSLPKIYRLIEKYKSEKNVVIFKSREETEEYLKNNFGS